MHSPESEEEKQEGTPGETGEAAEVKTAELEVVKQGISLRLPRFMSREQLAGFQITLRAGGSELEIPLDEITIVSNRFNPRGRSPLAATPRHFTCANCHERIERTGDPTEDHHRSMRHAVECPKRVAAMQQNQQWRAEFADQVENQMADNARAIREASARAQRGNANNGPWWKFW